MDIAGIEAKIASCEKEITELLSSIDGMMASVKEGNSTTSAKEVSVSSAAVYNGEEFFKYNFNGCTYNVIKTPNISVLDLVQFIKQYRLTQRDHVGYNNFGNKCLGVAKAYGRSLMIGKLPTDIDSFYGGSYTYFDNGKNASPNKEYVLRTVYNEMKHSRPCVIQIGANNNTNRHFGLVVGMKDTVTNIDELKEEDLLIIDAWDGQLEAMDNKETDRSMYVDDGKYRVDVMLQEKI